MALLAWAGQAYAQTPDDASAVDQYVEDVPTSKGSTRPGQGKSTKTTLTPSVSSQIEAEGGSDADLLREVASSSDYGAPQKAKPQKAKPKKAKADGPKRSIRTDDGAPVAGPDDPSAGEAISAAASAVQGGDASRLVALLIALFVITLAVLAAAGLRQKRRSS
jgi:hypothetical protein